LASAVGRGEADVAVGCEKIARQVENVDIVIRKEHFDRPENGAMLRMLRSHRFRNEFKSISG
jgi:putative molybdopterin biosynthesis protein